MPQTAGGFGLVTALSEFGSDRTQGPVLGTGLTDDSDLALFKVPAAC